MLIRGISPFLAQKFKYTLRFYSTMTTFTAIIQKEEDLYIAKCPEVGTVSQGRTIEEALANLKEATELYLEEFPLKNKTLINFKVFSSLYRF